LLITIRYCATGESLASLSFQFRVGVETMSKIIKETSDTILEELSPLFILTPQTVEEWKMIIERFNTRWNLPTCGKISDFRN
jgi:hypothetical protein